MELDVIVHRARQEFLEMPGLRLTPEQAARLWGLERHVCSAVIDALIRSAFLRWSAGGRVIRADQ